VLKTHGFALSFRTGQSESKITVTGVLSHRAGHSEETTIHLPSDTSGSKNAVQAVGSSTSYGKRYTASALLNLISTGEDDDGRAAGAGEKITEAQAERIRDMLERDKADLEKFLAYISKTFRAQIECLADIPANKFENVLEIINTRSQNAKAKS